jgi:hypothetical protein
LWVMPIMVTSLAMGYLLGFIMFVFNTSDLWL